MNKKLVPSIIIEGDKFIENKAIGNGGAIYLNRESLVLKKSEFVKNTAQIGGAIYFVNHGIISP